MIKWATLPLVRVAVVLWASQPLSAHGALTNVGLGFPAYDETVWRVGTRVAGMCETSAGGTAFLVDAEFGIFLTAWHVLGAGTICLTNAGDEVDIGAWFTPGGSETPCRHDEVATPAMCADAARGLLPDIALLESVHGDWIALGRTPLGHVTVQLTVEAALPGALMAIGFEKEAPERSAVSTVHMDQVEWDQIPSTIIASYRRPGEKAAAQVAGMSGGPLVASFDYGREVLGIASSLVNGQGFFVHAGTMSQLLDNRPARLGEPACRMLGSPLGGTEAKRRLLRQFADLPSTQQHALQRLSSAEKWVAEAREDCGISAPVDQALLDFLPFACGLRSACPRTVTAEVSRYLDSRGWIGAAREVQELTMFAASLPGSQAYKAVLLHEAIDTGVRFASGAVPLMGRADVELTQTHVASALFDVQTAYVHLGDTVAAQSVGSVAARMGSQHAYSLLGDISLKQDNCRDALGFYGRSAELSAAPPSYVTLGIGTAAKRCGYEPPEGFGGYRALVQEAEVVNALTDLGSTWSGFSTLGAVLGRRRF